MRFQMRALFFWGKDPCKKKKIAKAEPVAQNAYANSSKVLPDSDPTNKKSENRRHPRRWARRRRNKQR